MNLKRAELYFVLIDIVKELKLKQRTKKAITKLSLLEDSLNRLVSCEIVKE